MIATTGWVRGVDSIDARPAACAAAVVASLTDERVSLEGGMFVFLSLGSYIQPVPGTPGFIVDAAPVYPRSPCER
jgi:hypothetical protein